MPTDNIMKSYGDSTRKESVAKRNLKAALNKKNQAKKSKKALSGSSGSSY